MKLSCTCRLGLGDILDQLKVPDLITVELSFPCSAPGSCQQSFGSDLDSALTGLSEQLEVVKHNLTYYRDVYYLGLALLCARSFLRQLASCLWHV